MNSKVRLGIFEKVHQSQSYSGLFLMNLIVTLDYLKHEANSKDIQDDLQ